MKENIEDTKFRKERLKRLNQLKEHNFPKEIIEEEKKISKMTLVEYEIYRKNLEEENRKGKSDYFRNNPIKKSIVDEIYNRESKLEYDYWVYLDDVHFLMTIDPLKFMSQEDYLNELYKNFLDRAHENYRVRFEKQFREESSK